MTQTERRIRELFIIENKTNEEISKELNLSIEVVQLVTGKFKKRPQSKPEALMGKVLRELYPKYKILEQYRIGDLYLDYYIEPIRTAIEVDGVQHATITPFFHGKSFYSQRNSFEHQVFNDNKKDKLAKANFIYLIRIDHTVKITTENIKDIFNEHFQKIMDNLATFKTETRIFK